MPEQTQGERDNRFESIVQSIAALRKTIDGLVLTRRAPEQANDSAYAERQLGHDEFVRQLDERIDKLVLEIAARNRKDNPAR